MNNTSEIANRL